MYLDWPPDSGKPHLAEFNFMISVAEDVRLSNRPVARQGSELSVLLGESGIQKYMKAMENFEFSSWRNFCHPLAPLVYGHAFSHLGFVPSEITGSLNVLTKRAPFL